MVGPRLKIIPLNPEGELISVGAIWKKGEASSTIEKFVEAAGEEN
jgi:hypothetical protein